MIEVTNLDFTYPDGSQALYDVSVTFKDDHIAAVLGESGSGKTTLMRCISRFLEFEKGLILLDGTDIALMQEAEFRKKLGTVFQQLYLFPHLTVLENLILAPVKVYERQQNETVTAACEMLDRFGIEDLSSSYPAQISGGQKQRAAIARAMMLSPEYLLLDEPTSALDAKTTDEFAQWLRELQADTHFIIVTHDILFAHQTATQGIYLSEGRVLDTGSIDQIIDHVQTGGETSNNHG